jgi:DNA-binding response OmpR family regulator
MKILVVDDNEDITSALQLILSDKFQVDTFTSPVEALSKYKPGAYGLILLDVVMPGMNGFDFYREIRKRDGDVRIIIITALEVLNTVTNYENFRKEFPEFKDLNLMRKPFGLQELMSRIDMAMSG